MKKTRVPGTRIAIFCYFILVPITIVFLLEGLLRVLHVGPSIPLPYARFVEDNVLPFRGTPNSVVKNTPWPAGDEFEFEYRYNSLGFRDSEHSFEKPRNVFRIVGIGDSFTVGAGSCFEGTYLFQLQNLIKANKKDNSDVEIINLGMNRYWPEPERSALETIGIRYSPDLILVQFSPNDITDTYIGADCPLVLDGYLLSRQAYELGRFGLWLYLNSRVCRIALKLYLDHKFNPDSEDKSEPRWDDVFEDGGYHEKDWLKVENEYQRMISVAKKARAQIAFIYIPSETQEKEYARRRLRAWGQKQGVLVIDTLPALRNAEKDEKVYWEQDIHCTQEGYRVIAETVFRNLNSAGLLP
ncbi:MAG: SGNH/GDSL hydrolase family protein [Candidatus Omnitrophica bacterium]|nr:SGNH/GDSL hydrolase family protein [Candidatus Omnitrophota bacterium]